VLLPISLSFRDGALLLSGCRTPHPFVDTFALSKNLSVCMPHCLRGETEGRTDSQTDRLASLAASSCGCTKPKTTDCKCVACDPAVGAAREKINTPGFVQTAIISHLCFIAHDPGGRNDTCCRCNARRRLLSLSLSFSRSLFLSLSLSLALSNCLTHLTSINAAYAVSSSLLY
jgi:hypothetical protein